MKKVKIRRSDFLLLNSIQIPKSVKLRLESSKGSESFEINISDTDAEIIVDRLGVLLTNIGISEKLGEINNSGAKIDDLIGRFLNP